MSRLLAYLRVSTEEQGNSGLGLEAQATAIKLYCAQQGHEVAETVREVESANGPRRAFHAALQRVVDGEFDGIIAARLDRFSRSVVQANAILGELDKAGRTLVALDLSVDTSTAAGRMMMNIIATVAQWERDVIGERTSSALRAKMARGEHVGRARRYKDETRLRAWELRRMDVPWHEIGRRLVAEGHRPLNGTKRWQVSSLQRLVEQVDRDITADPPKAR